MISAIVAVAEGGVIGADNQIPWYLPADLAYFKRITHSHPIIMGRNCFESIGRPLPHRTNIVVTRNPFYAASSVIVLHDLAEALRYAQQIDPIEVFVIGGAEIYAQTGMFLKIPFQLIFLTSYRFCLAKAKRFQSFGEELVKL